MEPRLVAGLGNPGGKYEATRHNVGFAVLDRLVAGRGESWTVERRWQCLVARSGSVTFIKPTTYMNLSGRAVSAVSRFFKLAPEEILVVYDDVDLPLGRIRLRAKGSAGGHNGVKSIIAELGTDEFPRVKVGIGRSAETRKEMVDHVLGQFEAAEQEILEKTLQESVRAVECALDRGLAVAMNEFNRSEETKQPKKRNEKLPATSEGETGVQGHE
jgi:peptidyl-tRNA hydrolase, PTH1 family